MRQNHVFCFRSLLMSLFPGKKAHCAPMSLRDLGIIRFMRNCFFVHKNLHDYILKVLKKYHCATEHHICFGKIFIESKLWRQRLPFVCLPPVAPNFPLKNIKNRPVCLILWQHLIENDWSMVIQPKNNALIDRGRVFLLQT